MNQIIDCGMIARLLMKEYTDVPLYICQKVVSKMTPEQIEKDFGLIESRKGFFIRK